MTTNPIAIQSKTMLIESLLELMEDISFKQISIINITDNALLSRRTFYRHYKTKEDIISEYFNTIYQDYINSLQNEVHLTLPTITRLFFTFWLNHTDFLRLLQKNSLDYLLLNKLNESIPYTYKMFKGHLHEFESEDALRYALTFSSGGYYNTLMLWLNEGSVKSPCELEHIIKEAIQIQQI